MRTLRAGVRLVRIVVDSLLLFAVYSLGRGVLLPAPATTRRAWRTTMYRAWARRLARSFGIRAHYEGETPQAPCILAANHSSYLDVAVLAQRFDVAFIAKREVRSWPLIGMLAASVGTIFVNRESKRDALRVSELVSHVVREPRAVALFPEGTATDGTKLLPFKPALLEVAAREAIPVHPVAIRYESLEPAVSASKIICWGDETPLGTHAWRLLKSRGGVARVTVGPARVITDRKLLASQLWSDVAEPLGLAATISTIDA